MFHSGVRRRIRCRSQGALARNRAYPHVSDRNFCDALEIPTPTKEVKHRKRAKVGSFSFCLNASLEVSVFPYIGRASPTAHFFNLDAVEHRDRGFALRRIWDAVYLPPQ